MEEVVEESAEEPAEEPIEESTEEPEAELTVTEVAEAEPVAVNEEKINKEDILEDEGLAFHKTGKFKKTINKVSLALLLLAFAIPVGLLVYVILTFFL